MNLQQFTIKAQETLNRAQQSTMGLGQQSIEPLHLLAAIQSEDAETFEFLCGKMGVPSARIIQSTQAAMQSLPKVEGGQVYISQDLSRVIAEAETSALDSAAKDVIVREKIRHNTANVANLFKLPPCNHLYI